MLLETVTLIAAVTGPVAVAGAAWAARAAHRSALAAQEAVRQAKRIDRRGLLRDLNNTAHRVVVECLQIGSLVEDLKTEFRLLAASSGQTGGSREKLLIQRAETKQKEVFIFQDEAKNVIDERARTAGDASEEDLALTLNKLDGYLIQVLRIKNGLERELISTTGDNRIHGERRIKAFHKQH
jgi:hypothetical protein